MFGGVRAEKKPQKGPFRGCIIGMNNFEIFNLTTSNAMLVKLNTIVYLDKTFPLAKNCGVTRRA